MRFASQRENRASVSAKQVLAPTGVTPAPRERFGTLATSSSHFDCGFVLPRLSELEVLGEEGSLFVTSPL